MIQPGLEGLADMEPQWISWCFNPDLDGQLHTTSKWDSACIYPWVELTERREQVAEVGILGPFS
jgi:hypothetical protein